MRMRTQQPISDQLRQAVLRCGKTRYRISVETGISESILSRFVNRGAGLSLANIDKLCKSIGARLLFNVEPKMNPKTKG
jgi:hypothetical protein